MASTSYKHIFYRRLKIYQILSSKKQLIEYFESAINTQKPIIIKKKKIVKNVSVSLKD